MEHERDGSAPQASGEVAGLLTTKLHVPPRRSEIVPRPRLLERLDAHPTRRLTLLCAPAGYGKTTVAAEWIGRAPAVGWVSLDDGEIQTFRHLDKAGTWSVDIAVDRADPDDYEALVLPGGVANGDFVRGDERAVSFTQRFFEQVDQVSTGAKILEIRLVFFLRSL